MCGKRNDFMWFRRFHKLKYFPQEESTEIMNTNDFQIYLKSPDLIKEELSLWETKPQILDYLKNEVCILF